MANRRLETLVEKKRKENLEKSRVARYSNLIPKQFSILLRSSRSIRPRYFDLLHLNDRKRRV